MSTYREIVNMVLDRCRLSGDDSYIEPEHVLFLTSRLRAYLITSKYKSGKSQVAPSNFQSVKLHLEPVTHGCACNGDDMFMARSTEKVPSLLMLNNYEGAATITPSDSFGCLSRFSMVSQSRFATAGMGRWQKLNSYAAIGPDGKLYIKSPDSGVQDMETITLSGVFENAEKVSELNKSDNDCNDEPCDIMDMQFPLEEGLVTLLIENIAQVVADTQWKPQDTKNSSNDETGDMMQYINSLLKDRYRRNGQEVANE